MSLCPECGCSLPAYWPKGLCPQCALNGALEVASAGQGEEGAEVRSATGPRLQPIENSNAPKGQSECEIQSSAPATRDQPRAARFGDYELLEEVARGGMGVIYRARQLKLNRIVALKMILAGQFASKQEVLRFRSEAEAAANLQHPNIVRIHETGERDGHHYFSMDYVEGRTLAEIVRDGPLPAQRAAKYACKIAGAIHYAHAQGVLHRDLKPSNIIVDANDEPLVTDFGLAKRMRDDFGATVTGQVIGSPHFMPPEQTSAKSGKVGPASDVYGIGAVLYDLLTGRPPFHAETVEELLMLLRDTDPVSPRLLNPSVPRDLETICFKCLEKDPARRYATAQALADELNRFLRDEPIEARPLHSLGKLWRSCRRRPLVTALSASVFLLLIVVALSSSVAAWRVNRARTSEQKANRDLRQTISLLELERAEDFFSARDSAAGVAHLAAMLRRDPSNSIAANRLISGLVHRSWAVPSTAPMRHSGRVTSATFSPNGQRVVSASWDMTAGIWDAFTGQPIFKLGHGDRITCAHYSPNGDRIVTASASGSAQIWESTTGEPCTPKLRHKAKVNWAEFSTDGRWVVTASDDRTVRIWDTSSGGLKRELQAHTSPVLLVRFSLDGRRVVTGGSMGSIRIWDVDSGEMLFRVEDRSRPLTALALSSDGRRLVVACEDGLVRLWNSTTGDSLGEPLIHEKPVWHATFSPDSRLLLTACEDGAARLWDAQTLRLVSEPLRHESGVTFGEFSRDGQSLVTTSSDNTARVWDVNTGTPLCQPLRHVERVLHAGFSPDGRRLVTASYDGVAQIWQMRDRLEPGTQVRHEHHLAPFAFSPDGAVLLTAAGDKTARLWNARTGQELSEAIRHDSLILTGDVAPDKRRVVLGCADGTTRVWDCGEGKSAPGMVVSPRFVAGPMQHGKGVRSVRFNADGSRLVTASADGTARVWDATTGQPSTPSLVHSGEVVAAQFSRDGRFIVTASEDRTARVWEAQTGRSVAEPLAHIDHVKWAEFSPDGERVVTASTDNTACIWDARTGRRTMPPLQHSRIVHRAVFSPDGERIATASVDRTVRIWNARTGQTLTPPLRHDSAVERVYFNAGGQHVVTVCRPGLARVWDSNTGRPLTEWFDAQTFWGTCFDPVAERIVIGTVTGMARIWEMPRVPMPVPEWFPSFAEAVAGIRLGDRGNVELVARQQLKEFPIPSGDTTNFYGQLALQFIGVPPSGATASARTR